jgi:hypothetical protein
MGKCRGLLRDTPVGCLSNQSYWIRPDAVRRLADLLQVGTLA